MANKPENYKEMMEESTVVMNKLDKFLGEADIEQLRKLAHLLACGQDAQSVEIARQTVEFGYLKYKDQLPKYNVKRYVEQDTISDFAKKKLDDLDGTVIRWPHLREQ